MKNTEPTIKTLDTDVKGLKTTTQHLEKDVGQLKADVGVLKSDVRELKTDVKMVITRFDSLMDFLRKNMVTHSDLALMEERFDKKYAKQESLDQLSKSFDDFAKKTLLERQENKIRNHRIDKMEGWIGIASKKIKVPYKN